VAWSRTFAGSLTALAVSNFVTWVTNAKAAQGEGLLPRPGQCTYWLEPDTLSPPLLIVSPLEVTG
jgi:hypothetical protein